jgi:pyruvate/2-oxoglutarate dehydrogenase complex dihydrolipoamide dehydrogenase (E3) component
MPHPERFDVLVLGSGTGGKLIAWHMAQSGQGTAVVERRWIGGSCPNIACMPSKNEIRSAEVAYLAGRSADFGAVTSSVVVDMATVRRRKREMVERQVAKHLKMYKASGAQLIMGDGRFVAPKTLEVSVHDGRTHTLTADKVFLNVGTHAAIPAIPGLPEALPLTHVEALELDYLPSHLIVIGGGYAGLELALPPVRQQRDDHRVRASAHESGGYRCLARDAADPDRRGHPSPCGGRRSAHGGDRCRDSARARAPSD